MSLDDDVVLVEENRISESELLDDLRERLDRTHIDTRIVLVRFDFAQRQFDYLHDLIFLSDLLRFLR